MVADDKQVRLFCGKSGNGRTMYALMALAGDLGCSAGPTLVGLVAGGTGNSLQMGVLSAMVFPILILFGVGLLKIERKQSGKEKNNKE